MSREREGQLQVTNHSPQAFADASLERIKAQKELVEKLKVQWKLLWSERFDDRVRAEGVSVNDWEVSSSGAFRTLSPPPRAEGSRADRLLPDPVLLDKLRDHPFKVFVRFRTQGLYQV